MTPSQIFHCLDAISRTRALSPVESLALERAMARLAVSAEPPRATGREPPRAWAGHELAALRLALRPARIGRPRKDEANVIGALAAALGRSPRSVAQRMKKLRGESGRDQRQTESKAG